MSYYPPMQSPFMMPFQQQQPQQTRSINTVNVTFMLGWVIDTVENFPNGIVRTT